jgi:hypothetical protein
MWRAFFLAVGIYVFLLGVECFGVQKFVLKSREEVKQLTIFGVENTGPNRVLTPPDWAPWSLMSTGAVVCLYCYSLPRMASAGG